MLKALLSKIFLHHLPHTRLDILAPPLLTEVLIHVHSDGRRAVFFSKSEATPEEYTLIVRSVMEGALDLAQQHGGQITPQGFVYLIQRLMALARQYGVMIQMETQGGP